jgi:hypothetical protein
MHFLTPLHMALGAAAVAWPLLWPGRCVPLLALHYGVAVTWMAFGGCIISIAENERYGIVGATSDMHPSYCWAAPLAPKTARALLNAALGASLLYAALASGSRVCLVLGAPLVAYYAVSAARVCLVRDFDEGAYCAAVRRGASSA